MPSSPPALVPPKSDWDRPPWNRWAFQHVRELLPTVEVWRGNGPPSLLPQLPMDLGGIEFERSDGVPTTLETFLDDTYTDGFLVLHRGRIHEEGTHPELLRRGGLYARLYQLQTGGMPA